MAPRKKSLEIDTWAEQSGKAFLSRWIASSQRAPSQVGENPQNLKNTTVPNEQVANEWIASCRPLASMSVAFAASTAVAREGSWRDNVPKAWEEHEEELRHVPSCAWPLVNSQKRVFQWNSTDRSDSAPVKKPRSSGNKAGEILVDTMKKNILVPNWLVHDPLEHACRSDGEAVLPPNPVGTDGLTQCLGDTPARWKRLLRPDPSGKMPDMQCIIALAASYPKPPQRALYTASHELKRLLAQDGVTSVGLLFKPSGLSGSVAVYFKSGKVILQGNSTQAKLHMESFVEDWTDLWPLSGVAARRYGAAKANLPSPEVAKQLLTQTYWRN